jgi:hypothetical protein
MIGIALAVAVGLIALAVHQNERLIGSPYVWISMYAIAGGFVVYAWLWATDPQPFFLGALTFLIAASYEQREWRRRGTGGASVA